MDEDLYPAFDIHNFKSLARIRDLFCVTLYLPFFLIEEVSGSEQLQMLEYYLGQVKNQLDPSPLNTIQKREYLRELKALFNDLPPKEDRDLGLAIFISQHKIEAFFFPIAFQFRVMVNDHFYLQPITHLFNTDCKFLFLFMEEDQAKFYTVIDQQGEKVAKIAKGSNDEVVYFTEIAKEVKPFAEEGAYQIILLGPGHLTDTFSKVAHTLRIDTDQLVIHEGDTPESSAFLSRLTAEYSHYFQSKKGQALWKEVQQAAGFTDDIHEVVSAAVAGKVKTLFLFENSDIYGEYDHENQFVLPHSSNTDWGASLSNIAAIHTILHGGNTWILPKNPEYTEGKLMAVFKS